MHRMAANVVCKGMLTQALQKKQGKSNVKDPALVLFSNNAHDHILGYHIHN